MKTRTWREWADWNLLRKMRFFRLYQHATYQDFELLRVKHFRRNADRRENGK